MSTIKGFNGGSRISFIVQLVFILVGFYELFFADSFYAPYIFVLVPATICLFMNFSSRIFISSKTRGLIIGFSLLLGLMITFSNYNLWEVRGLKGLILGVSLMVGTWSAWNNIFFWIAGGVEKIVWKETNKPLELKLIFIISFMLLVYINFTILWAAKYPGNLSYDSIHQINQIIANKYSNHHPFWYTMTIKAVYSIGYALTHNHNVAVACYSIFSIVVMAMSFAFAIMTVSELRAPKWMLVSLLLFFALMPYHIMYSMTMWKDVFYGAAVLLFGVFLFRCAENMSLTRVNYIGLGVSALAICLYRSNGFFVFVFTTLIILCLWRMKNRKILGILLGIIAISFVMKHPVLKVLNVSQPDLVESLSIPLQQIARDVVDNDDFTEQQLELLNEVIIVEDINGEYKPYISDPIKGLVRKRGNQNYIKENAEEFLKFYVSRILKHPWTYVKGWIDQTRGYWNGGYEYWHWTNSVNNNNYDIYRYSRSVWVNEKVNQYLELFETSPVLRIFLSIGFFDWLIFIALFIAIMRHDKIGIMLTVPIIMNVISLLIATPVFSEMRYNYAVFCAAPVILIMVLRPGKDMLTEGVIHG